MTTGFKSINDLRIGMNVRYHPIIGEAHDGNVYSVRHYGMLGYDGARGESGMPVVWLSGKVGCVALAALSEPERV